MGTRLDPQDLTLAANTIRGLAMDGVQKAKSGHPGMPMGMADVAAVLWLQHLSHNPANPEWPNRDRFVLSAGHGSMLIYSLLHLAGYDLPTSELERFRQRDSRTPGHPEYGETPGVETTTGPLGQGIGNAVGMALAESMLAARFNTPDFTPVDHYTYAICSDGDLMEGISHEVFSLAGHLGLNKLIVIYDFNRITIEGSTDLAYSDNVRKRFQGYNWNVLEIDAHDTAQIDAALRKSRREKKRPTLIIACSHIGHGSPNKHDTASAHGEPLGEDEVRASKRCLGLPEDTPFYVPERVREVFAVRAAKLRRMETKWNRIFKTYQSAHPDKAALWTLHAQNSVPQDLEQRLPTFDLATPVATRAASGTVIQVLAKAMPQLVGGSADLAPSTRTLIKDVESVGPGAFSGRNFHFGIREHGMAAIMNGMALHGGFRIFGSSFFVFLDYCRPAVRLAAIMKLPVVYVFTHDSFYVGEDGPTHQPVEHLASLRCIPGLTVIRPADATESGAAWVAALRNTTGPTVLALTRQNLPVLDRSVYPAASNVEKGAYTLLQTGDGNPDVILIASGSEVHIAMGAAHALAAEANVRVVSMPSRELFERQSRDYREDVLPPACANRLAIEAGVSMGWEKYVGTQGRMLCMDRFGASAPYQVLEKAFGFTADNVVAIFRSMIA